MAAKARLSGRQLCTVLDELETAGELKRERSTGGRNQRSKYAVTVSRNYEEITLKKLQRENNSEICDIKTVKSTSHAINRHRTITRARASVSTQPNPAVNELKEFWGTEYQNSFGVAYSFNHEIDGSHFKALLATFDAALIKDRIRRFFDLDDEWIQTKGGYTVGLFRQRINTLNSIGHRSGRSTPNVSVSQGDRLTYGD